MLHKELKLFVIEINGWEDVPGLQELCAELESEGIECIECINRTGLSACANACRGEEKAHHQRKSIVPEIPWVRLSGQSEAVLILTDRQESVDRARALGIACVGFEEPEEKVKSGPKKHLTGVEQESVDRARTLGTACVGFEEREKKEKPGIKKHLSGVDMVVQGLEETGAEFYRLLWQRHHGIPWMITQTERLIIRESVPEDFDALYGFEREPGVLDYMPAPGEDPEQERQSFEAYIREVYPFYSYGLWTVLLRENGQIIGRVGLENGNFQGKPVVEIGYLIGQAFQGKGYGLEAVKAATAYGIEAVGAEALYAFIDERNERSLRLIQKAGYQKLGSDREGIYIYQYRRLPGAEGLNPCRACT